jgi:4-carboxymuconolactone decarboxylase
MAVGMAAGASLRPRAGQAPAKSVAAPASSPSASLPKDIFPETGNRLPAIKRDELDDAGKKLFDARGTLDAFGPAPIRLYSDAVAEHMSAVNDYLRYKAGLDPRLIQLMILATARENDCLYVWTAHEPQALKAGVATDVIDVVRYRKPLDGLAEKDAVIIQLARGAVGKHQVDSDVAAHALRLFGKQGMVNYVSLMGDYAATTVLLNAFDQHIRPADTARLPMP